MPDGELDLERFEYNESRPHEFKIQMNCWNITVHSIWGFVYLNITGEPTPEFIATEKEKKKLKLLVCFIFKNIFKFGIQWNDFEMGTLASFVLHM